MSTAIIGLASSGKTAVFNALTRSSTGKGAYGAVKSLNIGVGIKPDPRLDHLNRAFSARKKVNAEMTFWDMPTDYAAGALFNGETVNTLQNARAIVAVVRDFDDPSVPHPDGAVDWARDAEKIAFEILFADIALIDRRVERITESFKALKSAERVQANERIEALRVIQSDLENGVALRSRRSDPLVKRALSGTFAMSSLPLTFAVNIGENNLDAAPADLASEFSVRFDQSLISPGVRIVPICASLEEELRGLDEQEADELRLELGMRHDYSQVLMDVCLNSQGIQTFYTASEREVRAWSYSRCATAPEAAGVVHSDMERGFIRAEIVAFDDFEECGSMEEARKKGLFRQEGRDYVIQDGDIAHFLFSV